MPRTNMRSFTDRNNTTWDFWSRVDVVPGCCWQWLGKPMSTGYGEFRMGERRSTHVWAYLLSKGKIPDDLHVRHMCHNKLCCNPDHLVIGTHAENMNDIPLAKRGRPAAKLSPEQVAAIRQHLASGPPRIDTELARLYGVSQTTIRNIRIGKSYRHMAPAPTLVASSSSVPSFLRCP